MARSTSDILQRVEETLYTARLGLKALSSTDPRERMAGLRNLIVFGRAVTNVLQNLRSTEAEFDDWYKNYVVEMSAHPLMKFMYELRSKILKQGDLPLGFGATFSGNPHDLMRRFPPPPGAKSFFIGDQLGGSGWEVELPDGSTINYYIEVPADLPNFSLTIKQFFSEAPEQLRNDSIDELCAKYIEYLDNMVRDAKARFRG